MDVNKQDIEHIKIQIKIAQEWALGHFNAEKATDENLIEDDGITFKKPSFFVEFEADKMTVWPSIMGRKGFPSIEYRLAFNPLEWHGKHPFYNTPIAPLKVSEWYIKLRFNQLNNYGEDFLINKGK